MSIDGRTTPLSAQERAAYCAAAKAFAKRAGPHAAAVQGQCDALLARIDASLGTPPQAPARAPSRAAPVRGP